MDYTSVIWNQESYASFIQELKHHTDEKYRHFNESLIPGIQNTLGIRVPILRDIGKKIAQGNAAAFLALSKGNIYEEILLDGLVIGYAKLSPAELLHYIHWYADRVDNWALCDVAVSTWKQIRKNLSLFWPDVLTMTKDENPWIQRVGLIIMLDYYLTPEWIDQVLATVDKITSDAYYVQMAAGWLLATAAAKEREKTIAYLSNCRLAPEILKITAQKMRDSRRVSPSDKAWVTTLVNK